MGTSKNPWLMLWILVIAQFAMSIGAYAWGPLAPYLIDAFEINRTQIGLITSAIYVVATVIAIPGGMLVDRFGSYYSLIICLLFSAVPFSLMGLFDNYSALIVLAGISGIGYGLINQASTKGLIQWFPPQQRATVMGIKQTGVSLGAAAAAVSFPIISHYFGWQVSLTGIGLGMLLLAGIAFFFYKDKPEAPAEESIDNSNTATPPPTTAVKKNPFSLVWNNKRLMIVIGIFPFLAFAQICITSFLLLYLTEERDMSIAMASSCLTITLIGGTLGRLVWGTLSDRFFNSQILKACILLSAIGLVAALAITFAPRGTPLFIFYIISALIGFALIGWNAALMTLVAELAGLENVGSVMGVAITIGWTGIFIAPPIFGFVADTAGYTSSWLLVSGCALISFVGFLYLNFDKKLTHS